MHGLHDFDRPSIARVRIIRLTYAVLLALAAMGLSRSHDTRQIGAHLVIFLTLTAVSLSGYLVSHQLRGRGVRVFDMTIGLAIVAVATSGPLAAFVVLVAPDLVHLARRRGAFWNLGLAANVVSMAAMSLAAAVILSHVRGDGVAVRCLALVGAGVAMVALNYLFVRLLVAVIRDRENPARLIRCEFLGALPFEVAAIGTGIVCALLLPAVGIPVLVAFTALVYLPQLVAAALLRAPSVAALPIDDAATVYRDALADEMRLSRSDRRLVHLVDALAQRRQLSDAAADPLAAVQDALLVTICSSRAPTQRHFSATTRTQVVLVARRWAELTARCTPALNHREALEELHRSGLVQDAPGALAAAARIVEREAALTEHVAGVPRLHRTPLPRTLRHEVLPVALGRLAA